MIKIDPLFGIDCVVVCIIFIVNWSYNKNTVREGGGLKKRQTDHFFHNFYENHQIKKKKLKNKLFFSSLQFYRKSGKKWSFCRFLL